MEHLTFISLAFPGRPLSRTLLLLASLRAFGGGLAASPVWILYPDARGDFSQAELNALEAWNAKLIPFRGDESVLRFPLGTKVQAAAAGEELARGESEQLAWLDEDTLVLAGLEGLSLPGEKALAYRPVHHKLLGTAWGAVLDPFWELVYRRCGTSPEQDFLMTSHVGERIRPYFNAGCYTLRPERGILTRWWEVFADCYQSPDFEAFYERDPRYAVFLHQAVFTGVLLRSLKEDEMIELNPRINYPLHLHHEIPPEYQVDAIDDLVTARYESLLDQPGWEQAFPISTALADWINTQRNLYFSTGE